MLLAALTLMVANANAAENCRVEWNEEPKMEDGVFVGSRKALCGLKINKDTNQISLVIKHSIEKNKVLSTDGEHYKIVEETDDIKIYEDVDLSTTPDAIAYSITSTKIDGSGENSYLKELKIRIKFRVDGPSAYSMEFLTESKIDRPWYAPEFIFFPAARDKMISKVNEQLDKFIKMVSE